jgi:hypothetical protein
MTDYRLTHATDYREDINDLTKWLNNIRKNYASSSEPTSPGPEEGQLFWDSTNDYYKGYTGSDWTAEIIQNADTNNKGIASFNSDDFTVSSGVVSAQNQYVLRDGTNELTGHWDSGDYAIYSRLVNLRFESYDLWTSSVTGTGSVTEGLAMMQLNTGAANGSTAKEYLTTGVLDSVWRSPSYYGWVIRYDTIPANETVYLLNTQDTGIATNKERVGFRIVDGRIWAISGDETDEETTDTGADMAPYWPKKLHVVVDTDNEFKFYVDNVLKATHDEITCNGWSTRFVHYVTNSAAANVSFRIRQAFYFYYTF